MKELVMWMIPAALWGVTGFLLLRHTKFTTWIRYVHALSAFPLLVVLVVGNVVLTGKWAPELIELVPQLEAQHLPPRLVALVALFAAAPVAIGLFLVWVWLLERLEKAVRDWTLPAQT